MSTLAIFGAGWAAGVWTAVACAFAFEYYIGKRKPYRVRTVGSKYYIFRNDHAVAWSEDRAAAVEQCDHLNRRITKKG